jgi:hypothetical protein
MLYLFTLSEVVYIIGAGFNKVVRDYEKISPPLANDLFITSFHTREFSDKLYVEKMKNVFDYIESYFKLTIADLKEKPFDLETCFTLLENQLKTAEENGKVEEINRLFMIMYNLKTFMAEVLLHFEMYGMTCTQLRDFGKIINYENPTILTFNYDSILEQAIEQTSGHTEGMPPFELMKEIESRKSNEINEDEIDPQLITFNDNKWNIPLAYGIYFDEITLPIPGLPIFVSGKKFYSYPENQPFEKTIFLKMHGSFNWFRYLRQSDPIPSFPSFADEPVHIFNKGKMDIIYKRVFISLRYPPDHEGWLIEPVIITPILYKEKYYNQKPFRDIWAKSREKLSVCKKLVVIGYSFSPTDFPTKQLLIESFRDNDLEELIIVNPNQEITKIVKDLTHFKGGVVWYSNLNEYIKTFSKIIRFDPVLEYPDEEL